MFLFGFVFHPGGHLITFWIFARFVVDIYFSAEIFQKTEKKIEIYF